MAVAELTVQNTEALAQALTALGDRAVQAAGGALYREGRRIMAVARARVPVDMDTLRSSGIVQPPVVDGTRVGVTLGFGGAAKTYALFVHEGIGPAVGRPAFMPPVDAIRPWVRRHGIPEERAFVVARAIGRRGLRPTKYLESAMLEAQAGLADRLAADLRGELAQGR